MGIEGQGLNEPVTVCDAGPIIHLDELCGLDLLRDLGLFLVPDSVWAEVQKHRPKLCLNALPQAQIAPAVEDATVQAATFMELDAGETDCLALLRHHRGGLFLTDDLKARATGVVLGFRVQGTLGLLLRGARQGWREGNEIRNILQNLPALSSLHATHRIRREALQRLEAQS